MLISSQLSQLLLTMLVRRSLECWAIEPPVETLLHDHLLRQYFWPVRPVRNYSDNLNVLARFKLTRVVEMNLKEQILTLRLRIYQEWFDYKFTWNPENYGGVTHINLFSDDIWTPDFYPYYNGLDFDVQSSFVLIHSSGLVIWQPFATVKLFCPVEVQSYPFDIQSCNLTFGSWTYDASLLSISLKDVVEQEKVNGVGNSTVQLDLSEYCPSNEWDLVSVPGRQETFMDLLNGREYPFQKNQFTITLRRNYLFYLVNLVLPLGGLSYLSLLVFYLPADCGEKVTLSTFLLTSQVTFLLLLIDNVPVTSLAVSLLGKMIVFNLLLIFCSVLGPTIVLNVHHRRPSTHNLPKWVECLRFQKSFLRWIMIQPPTDDKRKSSVILLEGQGWNVGKMGEISHLCNLSQNELVETTHSRKMLLALKNITFVRNYIAEQTEEGKECEHWKLLAAVIDRILFICLHVLFFSCIVYIFVDASALYDHRIAVDKSNITTDKHFSSCIQREN